MGYVDVAFGPGTTGSGQVFVVVDLFRATTNIAALFSRGLAKLTVVDTVARARSLAGDGHSLLLGEEGGLPPEGFDHGNSPVESLSLTLAGREAILATTNGSGAICAAAALGPTYPGALANREAVCRSVEFADRIHIICAGEDRGRSFALEDFGAAGAFVTRLRERSPDLQLSDSAQLAELAWHSGGRGLLLRSAHANALRRLGLDADLDFAVRLDTTGVAPHVVSFGEGWAQLER